MKVTEKKLEDGLIELTAAAATAEVAQAFNVAHYSFCASMGVEVPQGQTPAQAAEEKLGIKDLDSVSQQMAIDYLVPFAVDKRNLCPAFPPTPIIDQPIKRGQVFEFKVQVTPKPDYELTSYEPVSITVPPLNFDESLVDQQIQQLAESFATYEKCDAKPLDASGAAKIALEVSQGGKRLDNLCTDGRTYILGMGLMPDEFEKNLIGMTEGDVKEFAFDMPGAPEGEAPLDCKVTVLECQEKHVPEVDQAFIEKNMPMARDVESLRQVVSERLQAEQRAQYQEMQLTMVADELSRRFQDTISDEVYESMRDTLMQNVRGSLAQQGIPFEQFVEAQGGDQQFGMMLMIQARQMLVQGYALDAVFRHEKMTLDDEDIMAACRAMNPADPTTARRQMEGNGQAFVLRETAGRLKANRWLLEHADITVSEEPAAEKAE